MSNLIGWSASKVREIISNKHVAFYIPALIVLLFITACFISTVGAGAIASFLGCRLDEGGTDCPGGEVFYNIGMMMWFAIFATPIFLLALVVGAVAHLFNILFVWRRN